MSLWKDTLFKVMALFGKLQEAWLSQENILAPWQFPLYGSSARNLLCLCSDNLQVLSAFFPLSPAIFAGGEPSCSEEAKEPFGPLPGPTYVEKAGFQS